MTALPEKSVLHLLHRAAQVGADRFFRLAGDTDCTPRQLVVLRAVAAQEGASQTKIGEMTGVDRSTLADIVRRLSRRGLIARRRTKSDARAYAVTLTADGRRMIAATEPVLAQVESDMLAQIPAKRRSDLVELLEMLGK